MNICLALTKFAESDAKSVIVGRKGTKKRKEKKLTASKDPSLTNADRAVVHKEARKLGLKSQSDGPEGARVLTCWKPANFVLFKKSERPPKKEFRSPSKPVAEVTASAPVLERDNSNSVPDFAVVAEAPAEEDVPVANVEMSWICEVCEADNPSSIGNCNICMMERPAI